ncbi:MAG: hypothetical protein KJ709_01175 [Nanoarchaeota archaeon]|nr:hypothetical protein [Nanoarchaeota archaeon]
MRSRRKSQKKTELLYIGADRAGQNIIRGSIETLKELQWPAKLYIVYKEGQSNSSLERFLGTQRSSYEGLEWEILPLSRKGREGDLEALLERKKKFDLVTISASTRKPYENAEEIKRCLDDAGFDRDDKVYYRFFTEFPNNWGLITNLAKLFKDNKVEGLVDIFTNQPDLYAAVWSIITGNLRTVMGNNHIDSHRVQCAGTLIYQKLISRKIGISNPDFPLQLYRLSELDALMLGMHGGMGSPFISKAFIDSVPVSLLKGEEMLYEELRDAIMNWSLEMISSRIDIRPEVIPTYKAVMHAMLQGDQVLGMSIYRRFSDNPVLQRDKRIKALDDHGTFIGYPTELSWSGRRYFWTPADHLVEEASQKELDNLVEAYVMLHNAVGEFKKAGLISSEFPKDEKYRERQRNVIVVGINGHSDRPQVIHIQGLTQPSEESETEKRPGLEGRIFYNTEPRVIRAVDLSQLERETKFEVKIDPHTDKYSSMKGILPDNDVLYALMLYSGKEGRKPYVAWFDMNGKKGGFHKPAGHASLDMDFLHEMLNFNDTAAIFDGRLYYIGNDQQSIGVLDKAGESYVIERGLKPDDKMRAVVPIIGGLVFSGTENFYRLKHTSIERICDAEGDPHLVRSLPDEKIILYSDSKGNRQHAFRVGSKSPHSLRAGGQVFDVADNGQVVVAYVDDGLVKRVAYSGAEDLLNHRNPDIKKSEELIENLSLVRMVGPGIIAAFSKQGENTFVQFYDAHTMRPYDQKIVKKGMSLSNLRVG